MLKHACYVSAVLECVVGRFLIHTPELSSVRFKNLRASHELLSLAFESTAILTSLLKLLPNFACWLYLVRVQ